MAVNRPTKIGKYDVIDVIGRGGMGVVYKGSDPYLDRLVAIKMMTGQFSDNSDLLKRFYREAQSTASLQHPNIVTVFELGDQGGNPYLVMEYLDGESLDSVIASRRQLGIVEKIELVIAICQGLNYAHTRGIVHRDIKPANIMVCTGGGVKIVDFGIAHFGDKNVTRTGQIVGSISYMSPEQVNGRQVDARTDIFSTGVVLYQLFTYALPFEGESTASTLLKIINEPPPPLKDFLASYPPQLQAIVDRALAKDRNERYASAEEFALELGQLQSQLKQEMISRYLQEATQLIENNDLHRAKGQVLQVLKIDRHHTRASHLLRELQDRIQRQEIDEEILQLRMQAEDAFGQKQYGTALEHLDRAISLDKNSLELQQLRDTVKAAEVRAQKFQRAVRLAESAHQMGDLDLARQTIEEALGIVPNDTHARSLQRTIESEWAERDRQRQLENYLEQARRDISSRKFTSALELLQQARALDPAAPQIRALMEAATAAKEQERRRRELEAINREIEEALNRDDYSTASEKADLGLKSFPQERGLLKLKALAEKQRQIAERKRFVDEQLALASSLLEQGRGEELVGRLETALAKVGGEPRLQSLLLVVRENVERERLEKRRAEYLQRAKDALRGKQHDEAVRILEAARNELQDAGEIDDLLQFAKEDAANEKRRQRAEAAAEQSRALIAEEEYGRAIQLLEATVQDIPDEELSILLGEARHAALDHEKKLESVLSAASKLIESSKASEALSLLNTQPPSFSRSADFQNLKERAGQEAERFRQIEVALRKSGELVAAEDYAGALALLEESRQSHGSTPELEQQVAYVSDQLSAASNSAMQKALSDARMLLNAAQHRGVLDQLALVAQLLPSVPHPLKTEYESLQQQAINGLARQRKAEIQRHVAAGEITGAAQLLQQTLTEFPGRQDLSELETLIDLETARKSDAQSKLSEAQALFERHAWKRAADLLREAFVATEHLPALREAVLAAFAQGAEAAVEADWRAAESLLGQAGELKDNYQSSPVLLARIAERKREDAVERCLEQAKRLQAVGDLKSAQSEIARGLSTCAEDPKLEEFQKILLAQVREQEQREKQQLEKQNFLYQVKQRADQETQLEQRTQILADALTRFPDEPTLELKLNETLELKTQVTELVNQARTQEEAKRYDEALTQWDALRTVYPQYPDLAGNVERLKKLSEEELAAKKSEQLRRLESIIASGDLEQAGAVLRQAQVEFPGVRQLADFEVQIRDAVKLRAKAQKLLSAAEKAFEKSQWEKGCASLTRGCEAAPEDPIVRKAALEQLVRAFEMAIQAGWESANTLVLHAEELRPDAPLLQTLRTRVKERRKEQLVAGCLSQASAAEKSGDFENALHHLESGLAAYPAEAQLVRAKAEIESRLRDRERARQEEAARQQQRLLAQQEEEQRREEARLRAAEVQKQEELRRAQQETQLDFNQTQEISAVRPLATPGPTTSETQTYMGHTTPEPAVEDVGFAEHAQAAPVVEAPGPVITPAPVKVPSKKPPRRQDKPFPTNAVAIGALAVAVVAAGIWWAKSLPAKVPLGIMTTPAGVSIRISNTNQSCVTPDCNIKLPPGNYEIEAQLEGYEPATRSISVGAQGSNAVDIAMVPLAERQSAQTATDTGKPVQGKPGQLVIRGVPAGAQVLLDGALKGRATKRGTFSADVPAGEHQVSIIAKNESPSAIERQFPAGGRVELSPPDFKIVPPQPPPSTGPVTRPEESDWARVKDSVSLDDLNAYLKRYPSGAHRSEAESKLDDISWAQAKASNSINSVRDYVNRYQHGRHVDEAQGEIARLDWQAVANTNDSAVLDEFLKRYPSGQYHDRAAARADDVLWSRTTHDASGLNAYLQRFPSGRHADEAHATIQQLAKKAVPAQNPDEVLWSKLDKKDKGALLAFVGRHPGSPHRADAQAILDQMSLREAQRKSLQQPLDLFNAAFEHQQPKELKEIWPGATEQYVKALRPPAGYKVSIKLQAMGDPVVSGDTAEIPCDLISETTGPGIQPKQNQKAVKVSLYKSGDRWLIRDPFGQ